MDRINQLFSNKKHDILSIYFCAGAPKADNTAEVITSLENTDRPFRTTGGYPQHREHTSHPDGLSQSDNAIRNGTVLQELQQHRHRRGNHPRPAFR